MSRFWIIGFAALVISWCASAIPPDQKTLPIGLADHERGLRLRDLPEQSDPPVGPVHSLGEWEETEAVMTLWSNPSLVSALVAHGKVKLIADSRADEDWWHSWLASHGIDESRISYFHVPTDSIWIRDYGPWPIVDGAGKFGLVHNQYNRPRPQDNKVAAYLAKEWNIPLYETGLTHTGGNYYSDGVGNAFSSTLVYSENPSLAKTEIDQRMHDFLGILRYFTARLNPGITIEHMDTYGKLVSADTYVVGEFPQGSRYRKDSEAFVVKLKTLLSPYGTPYKILRLRMFPRGDGTREDYRAYINSFISDHVLYYASYGDDRDDGAKQVYQAALPGYEIVGVSAPDTEWGDSVHCRNRNQIKDKTLFVFATIPTLPKDERASVDVEAEVIPTPSATVASAPELHWNASGGKGGTIAMEKIGDRKYKGTLPAQPKGTKVALYVTAKDSAGVVKSVPRWAPEQSIDYEVP